MFRRFFVRCTAVVLVAALVCSARASAQPQLAMSDRAPRFLLASNATFVSSARVVDANSVLVLRQRVDVDFSDTPIQEALTVIAEKAGLHLAYGRGVLPATRVQLKASGITVAGALTEVLMGSGLDVLLTPTGQAVLVRQTPQAAGTVVGRVTDAKSGKPLQGATITLVGTPFGATTDNTGSYRIANVPVRTYTVRVRYLGYNSQATRGIEVGAEDGGPTGVNHGPARVDFMLEASAHVLGQVVTTTTVIPTTRKALPNPITVVDAKQIDQMNYKSIDEIFRTTVPGGVQSEETPGPGGYVSFSVRGTSSIGAASSLKVLVDGIEVEDPAYVKNLDPSIVDHIEVVSGPQASTIYGSGAISGVMQIFTKRGAQGTSPVVYAKTSVAMVDNRWVPGTTPVQQDHSLSVNGGGSGFGYNVGGSYQQLGSWTKFNRQEAENIFGGANATQGPVSADLTVRYRRDNERTGFDPMSRELFEDTTSTAPLGRSDSRWSTYGITLGYAPFQSWKHALTLGYDGYANEYRTAGPNASGIYQGRENNTQATSIRYNTTVLMPVGADGKFSLIGGADYRGDLQTGFSANSTTGSDGQFDGSAYRDVSRTTGIYTQGQLSWRDQYFLTAGVHGDRSPGESGTAWTPRVGVSYVRDMSGLTFKGRFSYGASLVAPTLDEKQGFEDDFSLQLPNPSLQANRQTGFDTGIELYWGNIASVSLTYYDQTATNLIELIVLPDTTDAGQTQFQYQNIGRIKNSGFEVATSYAPASWLALTGSFGSATSKLKQVSAAYDGDYTVGDALNGIPKWTAGLTAVWMPLPRTTLTGSLVHRATWRETDFKQLFSGSASGRDAWIQYPAYTKVNLGVMQGITRTLSGFVQIDNVGNSYAFERINLITQMGRITTVGLKFRSF